MASSFPKHGLPQMIALVLALPATVGAQSLVSNDLLTGNVDTSPWQNCTGSDLISDSQDFDPSLLDGSGCVFRETPIVAGEEYRLTCGVYSFKYSSITLAFLNDQGETLATQTTDIFEDVEGDAYSVTLTAPAAATTGAVGIYGLAGSGFQDCTLFPTAPPVAAVDASIAGEVWADVNRDGLNGPGEVPIAASPVQLFFGDTLVDEVLSNDQGDYYFGGLDPEQCYTVRFLSADTTLEYTLAGGDNDVVTSNGLTNEVCPTELTPNITGIDAGFSPLPMMAPPNDYAVCGRALAFSEGDLDGGLGDIDVMLRETVTGTMAVATTDENGGFAFTDLVAGNYEVAFKAPGGYEFVAVGSELSEEGTATNQDGVTRGFDIPGESNARSNGVCTLRDVNAGLAQTVVALEPTIARDDTFAGLIGEDHIVEFLSNDEACDAELAEVNLIGHNVPGLVSYDAEAQAFRLSELSEPGNYSIEYGIRGACGSYDTASIDVVLEEAEIPTAGAPVAPAFCYASVGRVNARNPNEHLDVYTYPGEGRRDFAPAYRFFDPDGELVYELVTADAAKGPVDRGNRWSIHFKKRGNGISAENIGSVAAVENGLQSPSTACMVRNVTPIAIDIDRDGRIEAIAGDFTIDMDADGIEDHLSEWFAPTDGILIDVRELEGTISAEHLFGDRAGRYADGFAALAKHDTDGDRRVSGAELTGLAIWTDSNSNTELDDGELHTLEHFGIDVLRTDAYKDVARAQLSNGKTVLMRDLWFTMTPITSARR